jgi:hypothetical protein
MKAAGYSMALLAMALGVSVANAQADSSAFTEVLKAHVRDGRVDYVGLKADSRLTKYLEQLAATDPAKLASDRERLALWLNAYNAYTLKLIIDRQPAKSITEIGTGGLALGSLLKTTAWDLPFAVIGGRTYTLNKIEHEMIRARFKDARAHFALNCASDSCPVLRSEAYQADKLDRQLDEQGRLFLRDNTRNRFDLGTRTAYLSSIFKWYQKDFGEGDRGALLAAAKYASDQVRKTIEADPTTWKVEYLPYDWSLNDTKR